MWCWQLKGKERALCRACPVLSCSAPQNNYAVTVLCHLNVLKQHSVSSGYSVLCVFALATLDTAPPRTKPQTGCVKVAPPNDSSHLTGLIPNQSTMTALSNRKYRL